VTTDTGFVPAATLSSPEIFPRSPVCWLMAQAVTSFAPKFATYTNLPEGSTVIEKGTSSGMHTSVVSGAEKKPLVELKLNATRSPTPSWVA
jgi:hypothetical protein